MTDEYDDEQIAKTLRQGQPDVPAGLAASVMQEVNRTEAGLSGWRRWRRARHAASLTGQRSLQQQGRHVGGGIVVSTRTKVMIGVAGLAAVAIAAVLITGYPPTGMGSEGTVGAAKRYQGAAMSQKDVKVTGADLQKFLQSDTWHRLMTNKSSRNSIHKLFSNQPLQKAMGKPQVLARLADKKFAAALASPGMAAVFSNHELELALEHTELQLALADPKFELAFNDQDFQNLLDDPKFELALKDEQFVDALGDAKLSGKLNPEELALYHSPALQEALSVPAFEAAMDYPAFVTELSNDVFEAALENHDFLEALADKDMVELFGTPAFELALGDADFLSLLLNADFESALLDTAFEASFYDAEFESALEASLETALSGQ